MAFQAVVGVSCTFPCSAFLVADTVLCRYARVIDDNRETIGYRG